MSKVIIEGASTIYTCVLDDNRVNMDSQGNCMKCGKKSESSGGCSCMLADDNETNTLNRVEDNSIVFHIDGEEVMRINKEGFFIKGRKVADDKEIYFAFKEYLEKSKRYMQR